MVVMPVRVVAGPVAAVGRGRMAGEGMRDAVAAGRSAVRRRPVGGVRVVAGVADAVPSGGAGMCAFEPTSVISPAIRKPTRGRKTMR